VRALFVIASYQAFFGHNLHEFENRAVLRGTPAADHVMNVADGRRPDAP
jgi:hypothetical protein